MTFLCQSAFFAFSFPFFSPVLFVSWFMASIGCEVLMYGTSYWALIYALMYGSCNASCLPFCLFIFFTCFFSHLDGVDHPHLCYKSPPRYKGILDPKILTNTWLYFFCETQKVNFWRTSWHEWGLRLFLQNDKKQHWSKECFTSVWSFTMALCEDQIEI